MQGRCTWSRQGRKGFGSALQWERLLGDQCRKLLMYLARVDYYVNRDLRLKGTLICPGGGKWCWMLPPQTAFLDTQSSIKIDWENLAQALFGKVSPIYGGRFRYVVEAVVEGQIVYSEDPQFAALITGISALEITDCGKHYKVL